MIAVCLWSVVALAVGATMGLLFLIERGQASRAASLIYLVPTTSALMAYAGFAVDDRGRRHCVPLLCGCIIGCSLTCTTLCRAPESHRFDIDGSIERKLRAARLNKTDRALSRLRRLSSGNAGEATSDRASPLAQIYPVNGASCMTGHFVSHVREKPNGSRALRRWFWWYSNPS
jgi:hypothetical protein